MSLIHSPYSSKPPVGSRVDRTHSLSKGLVGHWIMNEGSGLIVRDISGNRNHGTLMLGARWSGGCTGSALKFDGTDDYVEIPNVISAYPITASYWFKTEVFASGIHICLYRTSAVLLSGFYNNELLAGSVNIPAYCKGALLTAFNTTEWNHVTVIKTSTNAVSVYVNGVNKTATTTTYWTAGNASSIGKRIGGPSAQQFNGLLDDVRIYNRVLSPNEIQQLYSDPFCNFIRPKIWTTAAGGDSAFATKLRDGRRVGIGAGFGARR